MARSTDTFCDSDSCASGVHPALPPDSEQNFKDLSDQPANSIGDHANSSNIFTDDHNNNNSERIANQNFSFGSLEENPTQMNAVSATPDVAGPDPACIQQVADQLRQIGDQMDNEIATRRLPSLDVLTGVRCFLASQTDSLVLSAHLIHSVVVVVLLLRQ